MTFLQNLVDDLREVLDEQRRPRGVHRKGRGLPVGTIRAWGSDKTRFQKQSDGAWTYYKEPGSKYTAASKAPAPKATPATPAGTSAKPDAKEPDSPKPDAKGPKKSFLRRLAGKAWDTLKEPVVGAYHLATSKKARKEFKDKIKKAVKQESKETKEMFRIFKKGLTPGQKVTKQERGAAIDQVVDLAKVALIGTLYGSIAAQGVGELLATLASPADEVAAMMLDGPLRRATKKVFGKNHVHGLFPSAFYSDEPDEKDAKPEEPKKKEQLDADTAQELNEIFGLGKAKAKPITNERVLLDRVMDALWDELAKEGITDEDIEAALQKGGMSREQATKFADQLQKIAQRKGKR